MQKWEYLIIETTSLDRVYAINGEHQKGNKQLVQAVGKVGMQGWELTAVTEDENGRHLLFFKRPAT